MTRRTSLPLEVLAAWLVLVGTVLLVALEVELVQLEVSPADLVVQLG
ncbi:hypothetical protein Pint_01601 [Pistacia integerrima]|uniref:Uncharacterized protein n=1 Tax=Pistacia integerrima TaxID=434235 RepID=A0ACC0ZMI4_9ROSI|nr:hypothetical protein Pint_01601 [Pistacia integerrima]